MVVGRPEEKRPLGRPRRRWEDNIKMNLREVGYADGDWITLVLDRDRWRAYVRAAMNLRSLILEGSLGKAIVKYDEYEELRWDGIVTIVSWQERVFRLWWGKRKVKRDDRYEGIEEFKVMSTPSLWLDKRDLQCQKLSTTVQENTTLNTREETHQRTKLFKQRANTDLDLSTELAYQESAACFQTETPDASRSSVGAVVTLQYETNFEDGASARTLKRPATPNAFNVSCEEEFFLDDNNALSESAMRIGYKICHEIAKELKTFNEGKVAVMRVRHCVSVLLWLGIEVPCGARAALAG
ncbi:hypothetical protein ANN_13444 [Periplaneta americana]|uniref:Uncharacterized protein n=1 Tax=Periplaneta americana TaxID=6978 RepID=A0ABQ8TM03_PERAM|nr:hypothetical protein ANN_13444 [Periplaneta americana]